MPAAFTVLESQLGKGQHLSFGLFGKWFIFWAIGMRLFFAGLSQAINPAFTAKEIFQLRDGSSYPIVRELGFANVCFGVVGLASLFLPTWRVVSAVASGLYYGLAGFSHVFKKPASANETLALVSDLFIFVVIGVLVVFDFVSSP
ncbi:MAG TPA: DUF6790 family protein [Candidatus Acidoferrales bacterium]|nr:DUF6790 family protein [Candidatus Acidoferrales bacterium]